MVALLIGVEGPKPDILAYLPTEGLDSQKVRYFHDHHVLNFHYYLSDENILDLGPQTEAILAEYRLADGFGRLLLALYPDMDRAGKAYQSLLQSYLHDADPQGIARLEDGKWSSAATKGRFVALVPEADSRLLAEGLLKRVMALVPAD